MAVRPLDLWNRWGIQILLLLSLSLQVLLGPLAGVRRRKASSLTRGLLWLAYQLANFTTIYAMGHLTLVNDPARERRLTAFWAPFLLQHQGGPDSIGAYALQDNQLWLRNLKLLIVQALAATYVLYKHLPKDNSFLQLAAFLMWAVGIAKYVERVVALKRGNLDSIRSSLKKEPVPKHHHLHHLDHSSVEMHSNNEEPHLRHAHQLFHIGKRATVDSWLEKDPEHNTSEMLKALRKKDYKGMWAFSEMIMSLMYDILYTKASVIHTWPGYIMRLLSSLAAPASFLLFHFSGKAGHSKVDVAITYTLLAGAFLLETTSLLSALGSTWAYAFLSTTRWSWLRYAALCSGRWDRFRRLVKAVQGGAGRDISSRRWSGKMGQYNMLHFSSRRRRAYRPVLGRVVTMFGFEEFWNRKHYSTTVDISDDLKKGLFEYIQRITKTGMNLHDAIRNSWGQEALEREDKDLYERMKNKGNLGVELQEGIIIWHIATDIFLARRNRDASDAADLVKSIRELSNYMMFLLVDSPSMLPGLEQTMVYQRTCENLSDRCRTQGYPTTNINSMLKEIFCLRHGTAVREQKHIDELASIVYKERPQYSPSVPRLCNANGVAEELLNREKQKGSNSVLKLLLNMWMDFLVYAANRCCRESHAKKISRGGELTTLVWIMTHYLNQEAYVGEKV